MKKMIWMTLALVLASGMAMAADLVVVAKNRAQVESIGAMDGIPVVLLQDNQALDAFSVSSGAYVGVFPAVVDKASGLWLPIPLGGDYSAVAAELSTDSADSRVYELKRIQSEKKDVLFQDKKTSKLKSYENKLIEYLREEGAIDSAATSVTAAELDAMYDEWDQMPDNKGDAKASKYERLLRPVIRNGGTETGVRFHK